MGGEALCFRTFAESIRNRMNKKSVIKNLSEGENCTSEIKNGTAVFVFYSLLLESILYVPKMDGDTDLPDISSHTATQLKKGNDEVHAKILEIAQRSTAVTDVAYFFAVNVIPSIPLINLNLTLDAIDSLVQGDVTIGKATRKKLKNARNTKTPADYLAEVLVLAVCNGKNKVVRDTKAKDDHVLIAPNSDNEAETNFNQESIVITESRPLHPTDYFRGRDAKLTEIKSKLSGTAKLLLLNGMGGIGKTEICRKLFHEAINGGLPEVRKIGWLTYSGSLEQTLFMKFPRIQNPDDKPSEYMHQVEMYINALGGALLLFVDNANDMTEKEVAWLLKLECKILLTSRRRNAERLQALEIGKLEIEDCRILYRQHLDLHPFNQASDSIYGVDYTEDASADEDLDAIIIMADRHTLAVELLAKTQRAAMQSTKKFRETLVEYSFSLAAISEKVTYTHNPENGDWDKAEQVFIEQFSKVLDISGVRDEKLRVMKLFSLLAPEPVFAANAKNWFAVEDFEDINGLVSQGWLSAGIADKINEPGFAMHPLVSSVVRHKAMPSSEETQPLIDGLKESIDYNDSDMITDKLMFLNHALSVMDAVSDNTDDYADFANNTAVVLIQIAEYEKCMASLEKARIICENAPEINPTMISSIYHNIAECHFETGNLAAAIEWYKKAIAVKETQGIENDARLASSYDNLGCLYEILGNFEKSSKLLNKGLEIRKEALGADHPSVAISFNNLGVLHESLDDCEKALSLYRKALSIQEKALDKNHPDTAATCNNIASLYEKTGEFDKALKWHKRSLKMAEATLGSRHPVVLVSMDNIANLYTDMGEFDKAEKLYKQILEQWESIQRIWHRDYSNTCNNFGIYYHTIGEYDRALEMCEKALVIDEKILGTEHPDTAAVHKAIADVYKDRGNSEKALEIYKTVLDIGIKAYGEAHSFVAVSLNNLGGAYADLGQHEKALPLYEKALAIQEKVFGRRHTHTAATLHNIAASYCALEKYQDALDYYFETLGINREAWPDGNPDIALICGNIAIVYDRKEEYEKAREWHESALRDYGKFYGEEHPGIADECGNFGVSLMQQGKWEEAVPLFIRAYNIRLQYFGEKHPLTADSHEWLKTIHEELTDDISFDDWLYCLSPDDNSD